MLAPEADVLHIDGLAATGAHEQAKAEALASSNDIRAHPSGRD
jgi:hypothetical protein